MFNLFTSLTLCSNVRLVHIFDSVCSCLTCLHHWQCMLTVISVTCLTQSYYLQFDQSTSCQSVLIVDITHFCVDSITSLTIHVWLDHITDNVYLYLTCSCHWKCTCRLIVDSITSLTVCYNVWFDHTIDTVF